MSKFFEGTQRAAGVKISPHLDLPFASNRSSALQRPGAQRVEVEDAKDERSDGMRPDDVLLRPSDAFTIAPDVEPAGAEGLAEEPVPEIRGEDDEAGAAVRPRRTTVAVDATTVAS